VTASITPATLGGAVKRLRSWSAVGHVCARAETPYTDDRVIHVVLPPRQLTSTQLTDLHDAGFDIVASGVLPSEVPGCPLDDPLGNGDHLLVRPPREDG
jgi:hypothetical protein